MHKSSQLTFSLLMIWLWFPFALTSVWAATYYVDFSAGNDANDGLSPRTAWKRSPGDPKASGAPRAHKLSPGDVVVFKGGVRYFGEINFPRNVHLSIVKPRECFSVRAVKNRVKIYWQHGLPNNNLGH